MTPTSDQHGHDPHNNGGEAPAVTREFGEAEEYEVLREQDVEDDPPSYRPIGPGDVFLDVTLNHLSQPFTGPVMIVGHPCSLRRGLAMQDDVPVAPVGTPGLKTALHPTVDRQFPVAKLVPPGSRENRVVRLVQTTTIPADRLVVEKRCASLSPAGVVALQQRVVGNAVRVKVPPGIVSKHIRGPLTELELWKDWRGDVVVAGLAVSQLDQEFEDFMESPSGFADMTWRVALAEHEHARGRAVKAMDARTAALLAGLRVDD